MSTAYTDSTLSQSKKDFESAMNQAFEHKISKNKKYLKTPNFST